MEIFLASRVNLLCSLHAIIHCSIAKNSYEYRKNISMANADYVHYINSPEWKEKAQRIKNDRNNTCEICGNQIASAIRMIKDPFFIEYSINIPNLARFIDTFDEWKGNSNFLVAHHKTYVSLGNESDDEIAIVCTACHVVITENTPRYGLEKAWDITYDYMNEIISEMKVFLQNISNDIRLEEEMEQFDRNLSFYSWLLPPKT